MEVFIYPEKMENLKSKPKNASWVDISLNKYTLKDWFRKFKVETIKDLLPKLYEEFNLKDEMFDRLKLKLKKS